MLLALTLLLLTEAEVIAAIGAIGLAVVAFITSGGVWLAARVHAVKDVVQEVKVLADGRLTEALAEINTLKINDEVLRELILDLRLRLTESKAETAAVIEKGL